MSLVVDIEKRLGSFTLRSRFETDGGILSLLGASGCGKSVTLKCIAGIMTPDKGRIVLDGKTLFDSEKRIHLTPQQRQVGYLFQQYALFPNMTVAQNIQCGIRTGSRAEKQQQAAAQLRRFRLDGLDQKYPAQLSGGQQQRVALARILASEPQSILLDEPFSALDSHLRFHLEREMRQTLLQYGKPVILVSHERDEVFRLSDRIAVMDQGRIEVCGTKHEVFQHPGTLHAARLTGCKNTSRLQYLDDTHRRGYAVDWDMELYLPHGSGQEKYIGIRMHDVCMAPCDEENTVCCRVVEIIENPFSYTAMLRPAAKPEGIPVGMELPKDRWTGSVGETIRVRLPRESLLLLTEDGCPQEG